MRKTSFVQTLFMFLMMIGLLSTPCNAVAAQMDVSSVLSQGVALKIASSKAYVYGRETMIDPNNADVVPFTEQGRTLVPVRFIAESFGAKVEWLSDTQTVIIRTKDKTVSLVIDQNEMDVGGVRLPLDVSAKVVNDRVFIPLRRLAEDALGQKVFYDRGLIILSSKENPFDKMDQDQAVSTMIPMFKSPPSAPYMIYYGALNDEVIEMAKTYPIVILHPAQANLTREQVANIQKGIDRDDPRDDVKVFGYISIGEDVRTTGKTALQMKGDPRFIGDGSGPRVDPRGAFPDSNPHLKGIDVKGAPSPGGTGFASYYLDDNDFDGAPDINKAFNGAFVNAGDPNWYQTLNLMRKDSSDGIHGLREILSTDYGRGLGCDGIFLDTIDTCAPNSYTDKTSFNQSEFEWTAPGATQFVKRLRSEYPDKYIAQNRGLFFFHPNLPQYQYTTRPYVDYVVFESFRMDSSPSAVFSPLTFADNSNNFAPKIAAEAGRPDGFVVLGLSYAEGPASQISSDTLIGKSDIGKSLLFEELSLYNRFGFIPYITNGWITLVNDFAKNNGFMKDTFPPTWSSTLNLDTTWPATLPVARVGLQQAVAGEKSVTLSWDVALDQSKVSYHAYFSRTPFDFAADVNLTKTTKLLLTPRVGAAYQNGTGPLSFPYEATVTNLAANSQYYFVIRAVDALGNEEKNQVVLSVKTK